MFWSAAPRVGVHQHPLTRIDTPPSVYAAFSKTLMPTCDICGEDNIGISFHCEQCHYDECEACHARLSVPLATPAAVPTRAPRITGAAASEPSKRSASSTISSSSGGGSGSNGNSSSIKAGGGSAAYLPLLLVTIAVLAAVTAADVLGLMRVTEAIFGREPQRIEDKSIAGGPANAASASGPAPHAPYYEATPDRVWQTTGRKPGNSRRAILYLVSNSTKERKRGAGDFPPGSPGLAGPDGYYVQHLYWSLEYAEKNLLPFTQHPDILILHSADVDGPAVARAAAKLTKSAVVAQPIDFTRTTPGYENATTAITTCWEGNDWTPNFMNMNYAFLTSMWSLPAFKKYDLLMRIDTDLTIRTRTPCDMFARAERHDLAFMYFVAGNDGEACTRGQKALAQKWAREHSLDTTTLDKMGGGGPPGSYSPVYHGALHLYNLTFWQRPDVQEMLRVFADEGGIWRHRWSDQSTFPFVLGAFSAKIASFGGFQTYHVVSPIFQPIWGHTGWCEALPVEGDPGV